MSILEKIFSSEILNLPSFPSCHAKPKTRLDANEGPYSLDIQDEVVSALASLNRYPDPYACMLREDISGMFGLSKDYVMLGNGSDEVISILVRAFGGVNGKVCFPVPTFPMYGVCAVCEKQVVVPVPLSSTFDIDIENFVRVIKQEKPSVILIASPNNPTGNCFSEEAIMEIINTASCPVVVDEAYCDFSGKTFLPLLRENENLLLVRTFSKIGFAGIRLGYVLGRPDIISVLHKVRLPFNINTLTQAVGRAVIQKREETRVMVEEVIKERERVFKALLNNPHTNPVPSYANFIMFKPDFSGSEFLNYLESRGVIVKLLRGAYLENCMRVTIGTVGENTDFLDALADFCVALG